MNRSGCRPLIVSLTISRRLCVGATEQLAAASGGAPAFEGPAWNSNTVDLIRLARAHCLLVLHRTFADSVQRLSDEARSWTLWEHVCLLYSCSMDVVVVQLLPTCAACDNHLS